MKILSAEFTVSAPTLAACPRPDLPEFAFIGRSNVGKSSLINLLTGQRTLAKVSDLPGKTRLINFFTINRRWSLVDLPGYGYAHGPKVDRANFNRAVAGYLERRDTLRCVFVLIDSRLAPQAIDLEFTAWLLDTGRPFALVFTKLDKVTRRSAEANAAAFQTAVWGGLAPGPARFFTSITTKEGRAAVLAHIEAQLAARPEPAAD